MNGIKQIVRSLFALWIFSLSSAAWAYIPPSFFIVKRINEKHVGPKGLTIQSKISRSVDGKPSGDSFTQLTHVDFSRGIVRSWAVTDDSEKLFGVERKVGVQGDSVYPAPPLVYLLFSQDVTSLSRSLIHAGVPIRTELELSTMENEKARRESEVHTLKRWNGGVSWVIGKVSNTTAQLWVEKDSFVPLRLLIPDKSNDINAEFRLSAFRMSGGILYPHQIGYFENNIPRLHEEVSSIAATSTPFKESFTDGWTPAGKDISSSVKELISAYYNTLR